MIVIASKVISIFIIMLVGFVAYKVGALGDDSIKPMTSLMMNITCPCLIVASLYSKELSPEVLGDTAAVMLGVLMFYIISSLLTYIFVKAFKIGEIEDTG